MYCLDGEVKVLTDKGYIKIKDLAGSKANIYTYDTTTGITYKEDNINVIQNGLTKELVEIELEDGTKFRCTPDHKLMLSNGEFKHAEDLTNEDELITINDNCGIYELYNTLNGKRYIGQSTNLKNRKRMWEHSYYKNILIENDLQDRKFKDYIEFKVLEFCTKDLLNERERYYIKLYNTMAPDGYNQQSGGKNNFTMTDELHDKYIKINRQLYNKNKNKVMKNWNTNVKNRFWYNNGEENIYIHPSEFEIYELNGYKRGRLLDNKIKNSTVFVSRLFPRRDVKQIDKNKLQEYLNKGYMKGLIRGNGYIWYYKDKKFISAEKLKDYLVVHGYIGITESMINGIVSKGIYKGKIEKFKTLNGLITKRKISELEKEDINDESKKC